MDHLIYSIPTEEPAIAGIGCEITATYVILFEFIHGNMGDPSDDGNESGNRELETTPKSSDAPEGSQRGHSTQRAGKLPTWGRATACRCFGAK
jgi:hypothetical protein